MLPIQQKLTPYNFTKMYDKENLYIVVHYVGSVSTAKNNADYFARMKLRASAHYFVDESSIWQIVLDKNRAWHCGGEIQGKGGHTFYGLCTNSNSIGIEMCCKMTGKGEWYFEEKTEENTANLIKYLMAKHNVPIERVIRHYDVTGKKCPAPYVDDKAWEDFKERITKGGELSMTQYEELKAKIERLEKSQEKIYHLWSELPDYAYDIIKELYSRGIYKGSGSADLNLPESLMRSIVINYRAGVYNK